MSFQEQIKALPEDQRTAFFRGIVAVAEAGRKTGATPEDWAKTYAETYKAVTEGKEKQNDS